jgi:NTP pyrophosphatase (non-canonical NTP hydrolase)
MTKERPGALTLSQYQALAMQADHSPDKRLAFPLLGLFGEAGSLLSVVKKKQRDRAAYVGYAPSVIEELGDLLWYFTAVAARGGVKLSDIGNNLRINFSEGRTAGSSQLRFRVLQAKPGRAQDKPTPAFEKTLLDLAGEVGTLVAHHRAGLLPRGGDALRRRLVPIMRTMLKAADEAGVTLEQAAEGNLKKIFDRWPTRRSYPPPFDEDALLSERLPRSLTIDVFERNVRDQAYVFQQCNGVNIGDRLTDNAIEPDDYRFHDVFHFAYCAVLTWSPVTRVLLRLKRKSDPKIDEAEDGARAILIEEGIAAWIFGQAKQLDFFAGMRPGDLSFDILKTVRQFVSGYEPEPCPLWLWEEAILRGFEAFRFLRRRRRARLRIDMARRRLVVGDLPRDT